MLAMWRSFASAKLKVYSAITGLRGERRGFGAIAMVLIRTTSRAMERL